MCLCVSALLYISLCLPPFVLKYFVVLKVHYKSASPLSFILCSSLAPPSQFSTCRDCLHLQHTWGIKEDEIHSFMGGVTVQDFIYGAASSLMKPEVILTKS